MLAGPAILAKGGAGRGGSSSPPPVGLEGAEKFLIRAAVSGEARGDEKGEGMGSFVVSCCPSLCSPTKSESSKRRRPEENEQVRCGRRACVSKRCQHPRRHKRTHPQERRSLCGRTCDRSTESVLPVSIARSKAESSRKACACGCSHDGGGVQVWWCWSRRAWDRPRW